MIVRQLDIEELGIILDTDAASLLRHLNTLLHGSYLDGHSIGHREGVEEGEQRGQKQGFQQGFNAALAATQAAVTRLGHVKPCESVIPIEILDLSVRMYGVLKRNGIHMVGQILEKTEADIRSFKNVNTGLLGELKLKLQRTGFNWE